MFYIPTCSTCQQITSSLALLDDQPHCHDCLDTYTNNNVTFQDEHGDHYTQPESKSDDSI